MEISRFVAIGMYTALKDITVVKETHIFIFYSQHTISHQITSPPKKGPIFYFFTKIFATT